MRMILFVFAACFAWSTVTIAQETTKAASDATKAMKTVSVTGMISADGKSFVGDKNKKTWSISNPDAVKGHEGHHVVLKAHANPNASEIEVVSVKMAKARTSDEMPKY